MTDLMNLRGNQLEDHWPLGVEVPNQDLISVV